MKRLQRSAVLLSLIEALRKNGSWCGGTNVQKAAYFLQELLRVPLQYDFILYKHGPYSFDLTDELTGLRADSILELRTRDPQYGPCYAPGKLRDYVIENHPNTLRKYRSRIEFVASKLGSKNVSELERLATALFVQRDLGNAADKAKRAAEIVRLKPHVQYADAMTAVREVDEMHKEADELSAEA